MGLLKQNCPILFWFAKELRFRTWNPLDFPFEFQVQLHGGGVPRNRSQTFQLFRRELVLHKLVKRLNSIPWTGTTARIAVRTNSYFHLDILVGFLPGVGWWHSTFNSSSITQIPKSSVHII